METKFRGILKVNRFFGVKSGRSVWKETSVYTRVYSDKELAHAELLWLIDIVAPAMNVCVLGYCVESFLDMSENLPL